MNKIDLGLIELVLYTECWHCGGTGRPMNPVWAKTDNKEICSICDGAGSKPTDAGEAILELVLRHTTAKAKGE